MIKTLLFPLLNLSAPRLGFYFKTIVQNGLPTIGIGRHYIPFARSGSLR
jgi:hypothetical protein